MEIDSDGDDHTHSAGECVIGSEDLPAFDKAIPWVEKYRPQSLDDVAAHRDIVDTSKTPSLSLSTFLSLGFMVQVVRQKLNIGIFTVTI